VHPDCAGDCAIIVREWAAASPDLSFDRVENAACLPGQPAAFKDMLIGILGPISEKLMLTAKVWLARGKPLR
jgi:hypothetical protein